MNEFLSVVDKWLPVFSAIVSVAAACFVAKIQSKNEIKKIFMSFDREDLTQLKQTFSELLSSIDNFLDYSSGQRKKELRQAISNMIAIAPDKVADILSSVDLENKNNLIEIKSKLISTYPELVSLQNNQHHNKRKQKP